jgi:hypothetical protein
MREWVVFILILLWSVMRETLIEFTRISMKLSVAENGIYHIISGQLDYLVFPIITFRIPTRGRELALKNASMNRLRN